MRISLWLAGLLLAGVAGAAGQQSLLTRAVDLERRGDYTGAARIYRGLLEANPGDVSAVLGLERSLQPLNRTAELAQVASAALAVNPEAIALYSVAVRAWSATRQPDSARRVVSEWAAREPGSEAPFQEWGMAALQARDRASARAAYLMGRTALGSPDALAGELAQLATLEGDYAHAVPEWITAITKVSGYKGSAVALLSQVPTDRRSGLLAELGRHDGLITRRITASLQARWGHPVSGFRWLQEVLPEDRDQAIEALQDFLEEVRILRSEGRETRLAQGMALERLAALIEGPQASRTWLDAAQAYADAGDQAAARRMLGRLASDRTATPTVAAQAASTLVGVLIEEGKIAEADAQLRDLQDALGPEERDDLRYRLARGWLHRGGTEQAERLLVNDSTVEGLALRGRARLYRGDLAGAREFFTDAGPFAMERSEATFRAGVLAVLQVIAQDTLAELGTAWLALEQDDTLAAIVAFEQAAAGLPGDGGGGELSLLAGRLQGALGDFPGAERTLRRAVDSGSPAAAAGAELALAELLSQNRRVAEATQILEHLILTYPQSTAVPPARRLLEQLRGGIPGSEEERDRTPGAPA